MSIFERDHGTQDGNNLLLWAKEAFERAMVPVASNDTITFIAHPRIFGYAFNPISFYLLRNSERELKSALCEVHNTFGDNHTYALAHHDLRPIAKSDVFTADKKLYVSPFNTMEGQYSFQFDVSSEHFGANITYKQENNAIVRTAVYGTYTPCTSREILLTYLTHPLMTVLVIVRIHWQAIKLFFKRVPHTLEVRPEHTGNGITRGFSEA